MPFGYILSPFNIPRGFSLAERSTGMERLQLDWILNEAFTLWDRSHGGKQRALCAAGAQTLP